jgi:hypothetical protein
MHILTMPKTDEELKRDCELIHRASLLCDALEAEGLDIEDADRIFRAALEILRERIKVRRE